MAEYRLFTEWPRYVKMLFSDDSSVWVSVLKGASLVMVAIGGYLFPTEVLRQAAVAAFICVCLDAATGVTAAVVEKKPRTSQSAVRTIIKLFAYLSVCAVASVTERTLLAGSGMSIIMGVLWLIIATEGLSILENVERIGQGRFKHLRSLLGKVLADDEKQQETKHV